LLQVGKSSRDKELLADIKVIRSVVPDYSIISIPQKMMQDSWSLQCYCMRYANISIANNHTTNFYLVDKNDRPDNPEGYKKADLTTVRYDLFIK